MAAIIDYGITEEQQEIINLIDEFGKERIVPVRAELDEKGIFPADLLNELAQMDLMGLYIPEEYGGVGAGYVSYGLVAREVERVEWDTLLFFFGVIMCVGGLSFIGYLEHVSAYIYGELGPTTANVLVGVMSAIVDNIPIMVAVLEMHPVMDTQQWLLVTLTAGVGGSMLSIGSAAGVALMGQARGEYTFFRHLKWTPVIALGYAASIWVHLLINRGL